MRLKRYKSQFTEDNKSNYDLESKYAFFNKEYFNNELPHNLTLEWSNKLGKSVLGQASPNKIAVSNRLDQREIELDSTLVHEMIHVLQYKMGVKHGFHRDSFKREAARINSLNPKLHIDTKSSSLHNQDIIDDLGLEIIPIYMALFVYSERQSLTVQSASELHYYSMNGDIDEKIKHTFARGFSHQAFLFEVNANTPNFMYDSLQRFIDSDRDFTQKSIKGTAGLIRKDKENIKFIRKYSR